MLARVCRFLIQDLVGNVVPAFKSTESWTNNVVGSALASTLWGWFLYQGVIDPLGGIWTLWPLFGTANQMLAAMALTLCTVVLFKMKRQRYAFVTIVPAAWLVICTVTAGWQKVFSANPAVGFLSHAARFAGAAAEGKVLAPAKTLAEMNRIVFNDRVDATLAALFAAIVVAMVVYGVFACIKAMHNPRSTALEIGDAVAAAGDD
jgi:carbon starvation protein CstA